MDTLHVYSQEAYHDAVFIVGDLTALRNLRDTIDKAINSHQAAKFNTFTSDGEGYTVSITPLTEAQMDTLRMPYYGEIARDHRKHCKWPWQLDYQGGSEDETCLTVSAKVRYWEDAKVHDYKDCDGKLIPFRNGDLWEPVIRLRDGQVMDWPTGLTANVYYKVCDEGSYWISLDGQKLYKYKGNYVPDEYLCHGNQGYGDYIILNIDAYGKIEGWRKPEFKPEDWTPCN